MSRGIAIAMGVALGLVAAPLALPGHRPLVWNASASLPTGLYAIRGKASLHVGERIAINLPPMLSAFAAERGYLPTGIPLLKRVAAFSGQRVCRFAHGITIDGGLVGVARGTDSRGRPLPIWSGCLTIAHGQIFVLNTAAPDSFDGRYFGPTDVQDIIGRATPIWTDEGGDGRHVWFASPPLSDPSPQTTGDRP